MAYPKVLRDRIKKAYLSGKYNSVEQIAKEFGVAKVDTIYRWANQFGWGKQAKKIEEVIDKRIEEKVIDQRLKEREEQVKVGRYFLTRGAMRAQEIPNSAISIGMAVRMAEKGARIVNDAYGDTNNININVMNVVDVWKAVEVNMERLKALNEHI